jgi:hypothetical protein
MTKSPSGSVKGDCTPPQAGSPPFARRSADDDHTRLTDNPSGHDLGWTLTFMLGRANLTWDTDGEIVFIGSQNDVARFRRLADTRSQRRAAYPESLADKLQARYEVATVRWPLKRVCDELSTASGIAITPDQGTAGANPRITVDAGKYPLDIALDLMSHRHDLTWEIRGEQVLIRSIR